MCDINDRKAVEKLYTIKGLSPKKQLSILCRHLQDISTYTLGFPASNRPVQIDTFRVARQVLPGPVQSLKRLLWDVLHANRLLQFNSCSVLFNDVASHTQVHFAQSYCSAHALYYARIVLRIVGLSAELPKVTLMNLNYILSTLMTALKAQILLICSTLSS